MIKAEQEKQLGYFDEGEPTNAQMNVQDDIDNAIEGFLQEMTEIY